MSELNVDIQVQFAGAAMRDSFAKLLACYSSKKRDRKARIQDAVQQLSQVKIDNELLAVDAGDVEISELDTSGTRGLRFHVHGGVSRGWVFWTTLYKALLQSKPQKLVAVADDDQTAELTLYTFDGVRARTYYHGDPKWDRLLEGDIPDDQPLGRHLLNLAHKAFFTGSGQAKKKKTKPVKKRRSSGPTKRPKSK